MSEKKFITGPYRATKLWNDAIRSFHKGMPLSRHWRGLRQYDSCFTGAEAVAWLHDHLQSDPNFGSDITREQTLKLLRKFFKNGLIVEARGNKIFPEELRDNRELFRFSNRSPLKSLRTPGRTPLASINSNVLRSEKLNSANGASPSFPSKAKVDESESFSMTDENPHLAMKLFQKENLYNERKDLKFSSKSIFCPVKDSEDAWCQILFEKLEEVSEQLMVGGDGSAPIIPLGSIDPKWVKNNALGLHSDGTLSKTLLQNDLPSWIVTAMKSLANWPLSSDSICNIPNYPGVELDIFKIVREFFANMVVPLIPYELYDPIVRLYIGAEFLDIHHRTPKYNDKTSSLECHNVSISPCDSVENLIHDISIHENQNSDMKKCSSSYDNIMRKSEFIIPTSSSRSSTPACIASNLLNTPASVQLKNLEQYTNFKDSALYTESALEIVKPHQQDERKTLKSLKNKSRNNAHMSAIRHKCNSESSSDVFSTLLKTEDLDHFPLPPNSCFETAFTSDSPKTRVIPQKTVDSIHFRNVQERPKSIAVSSFISKDSSKKDTRCPNKYIYNGKNSTNRSLSEGNFLLQNDLSDSSSIISTSTQSLKSEPLKGNRLGYWGSKGSLASRVRDSIKRKMEKNSGNKRGFRTCSKSAETLLRNPNDSTYADPCRLRTRSGGYENPCLIQASPPSETSSIKSSSSDLNRVRSESGLGSLSKCSTPDPEPMLTESLDTAKHSRNLDTLSILSRNRGLSPILSSTPTDSGRDCSSRCSSTARPRSHTPNGCLSHSMGSCVSNSIYLSALSGLNATNSCSTLNEKRSASVNSFASDATTTALEEKERFFGDSIDGSQRPKLPERAPVLTKRDQSSYADLQQHDYENVQYLSKQLSNSASELSDRWRDRTPYGRAPPYIQGGMWRHYRSSPSKRLVGRRQALGNKACLPGLLTKAGKDICTEALQTILLLLEPHRRGQLRLLLRMMQKASANERLQLGEQLDTRALMVKTFVRCVLRSEEEGDYDEILASRILTFIMDNQVAIFAPPSHVPVLVHRRIALSQRRGAKKFEKVLGIRTGDDVSDAPGLRVAFCHQVSPKSYAEQKMTGSQKFLADLLGQIIQDSNMADKEKRKKLKEFKMHYPDIYRLRFPENLGGGELVPSARPRIKPKLKGLKKFTSITKARAIRL